MDAGVPIKAPVAGIAMGLIKDGERLVILDGHPGLGGLSGRYGLQSGRYCERDYRDPDGH